MEPDEFTLVVNKRKPNSPITPRTENKRIKQDNNEPISTQNSFEPLTDSSDENDTEMDVTQNPAKQETRPIRRPPRNIEKTTKTPKVPPIVLHGNVKSSAAKFRAFIEHFTKSKDYEVKYTDNRTTIYLKTIEVWKAICTHLKEKKYEFHTYTATEEKNHSFVLCGLTNEVTVNELQEELIKIENLHLKKLFEMNDTRKPKFLVITDNTVTAKTISNIRIIFNTRISWQRYHNRRTFIQCHNCQQWGHATSNCFAQTKCLICADNHATKDCGLADDKPPLCVHCNGPHPANDINCPVYKRLLDNHNRRKNTNSQHQIRPQGTQRVPDINSHQEFRPLSQPKTSQNNAWGTKTTDNTSKTEYDDMMHELKRLNSLIDMKKFTENLKILNDRLESCTTDSQKFTTMQTFYTELDSNGQ